MSHKRLYSEESIVRVLLSVNYLLLCCSLFVQAQIKPGALFGEIACAWF